MTSMTQQSREGMVKVRVTDPTATNTETLWARQVDTNLYELDNSPFFAYGISWQDVIEAKPGDDDVLEYVRCVRKSGNRTLRIIFRDYRTSDPAAEETLQGLRSLGCSYEGMQPRMVAVNVPPAVNLGSVIEFLKRQSGLQWEYADPTYERVTRRVN